MDSHIEHLLSSSAQLSYIYETGFLYNSASSSFAVNESNGAEAKSSNLKVPILAGPIPSTSTARWRPTAFASFVGKGMLDGVLLSNESDDDEDAGSERSSVGEGESVTQTSIGQKYQNVAAMLGEGGMGLVLSTAAESEVESKALHQEQNWKAEGIPLEHVVVCDDVEVTNSMLKAGSYGSKARLNRSGGAGVLLAMKMCGALSEMGWQFEDVERVAGLAKKNLMTVNVVARTGDNDGMGDKTLVECARQLFGDEEATAEGSVVLIARNGVSGAVARALELMLDQSDQDRACVSVNSNEVVVLINHLGELPWADLEILVNETRDQMHEKWNIWPARIYAGPFLPSQGTQGFSISILNVVNTDIGGPSMVQLLDEPCEAQGWNDWVGREAWNNRSCVSREWRSDLKVWPMRNYRLPSSPITAPAHQPISAPVADSETSLELSAPTEAIPDIDRPSSLEARAEETLPRENDAASSPIKSESDDMSDDPATNEVFEEPTQPNIQHPTWEHEDGDESLFDMIRRQSSKLVPASDKGEAVQEAEGVPESEKAYVLHPEHEHDDESLLDMIRRHASKPGHSGTKAKIEGKDTLYTDTPKSDGLAEVRHVQDSDPSATEASPRAKVAKAELSGEEDYEVV